MGEGGISVTRSSGSQVTSSGGTPSTFIATKYTSVANPNALPPEENVQDKSISDSFTLKYSDAGSYDHTKDLNLPSLPPVNYNSKHREALVFGALKSTERESKFKSDGKIEATEDIKCKALIGDCNCPKCYDSSGFYWG